MSANQKQQNISFDLKENPLLLLVVIQMLVYVLFSFVNVYYLITFGKEEATMLFSKNIYNNLSFPLSFQEVLHKPWTTITHFFYHAEMWQFIGNMIWLLLFGFFFQEAASGKKIIPFFIYGAIGGATVSIVLSNTLLQHLPNSSSIIGASAGVFAIAIAATMLLPTYRIFPMLKGGIPLFIITAIYIAIDLLTPKSTGEIVADLAGGITGALLILFLNRGYDASRPMNNLFDWFNNLFHPANQNEK